MPSEFRLLFLPLVALRHVLKLMSPFELISLSFCSQNVHGVCKSIRSKIQCENSCKMFQVCFESSSKILLDVNYFPNVTWTIDFGKISMEMSSEVPKKLSSLISTWVAKENKSSQTLSVNLSETSISAIDAWIQYISYLFNVPLENTNLFLHNFEKKFILKLIDFHCNQSGNLYKNFNLYDKESNSLQESNNEFYQNILSGFQNTNNLIVRFKPSQTFNFDFKTLKTRFKLLDFRYSHWVSLDQLLEADTSCICLSRSNFTNSDFKTLVDKWRAGWTPKWTSLMIEFKENLDIDTCVGGEPFHTVPRNIKPLMKLVVEKESPIQLYKFDMFRRTPEGFTHKTGYHIYRSDDVVATITVEKNRIGWIEIQPFDCDVEFRFHLHMRTFQLD